MSMKNSKKINDCRGSSGYINLNKLEIYREKGEIVEGSNAKSWFNVDGTRFLFKEYDSVLPAFGEVLYSNVGLSCGVDCAKYDFAQYNGNVGTISYDFLNEDKVVYYNFLYLTAQFTDAKFSLDEIKKDKNLLVMHNNKYNNLTSINELVGDLFTLTEEEKNNFEIQLVKMMVLDTVFWHRDRNLWNYGVIVNEDTDAAKLASIHDNSYVLFLEKGEDHIEETIASLIAGGKISVGDYACTKFYEDDGEEDNIGQLIDFYEQSNENVRKVIEDLLEKIDVEKEINKLRKIVRVGDVATLWMKAVLNYRKDTILKGLESARIISDVPSKPNVTFSKRK